MIGMLTNRARLPYLLAIAALLLGIGITVTVS
jgi:hypothetical protein